MSFSRSLPAILMAALLLMLTSNAEARCHNLSSTAFTHCPKHSDEAHAVVDAAATAPYPIKALATGQSTPQGKIENHQAAAISAPAPPPEIPLQNGTFPSPPRDFDPEKLTLCPTRYDIILTRRCQISPASNGHSCGHCVGDWHSELQLPFAISSVSHTITYRCHCGSLRR